MNNFKYKVYDLVVFNYCQSHTEGVIVQRLTDEEGKPMYNIYEDLNDYYVVYEEDIDDYMEDPERREHYLTLVIPEISV